MTVQQEITVTFTKQDEQELDTLFTFLKRNIHFCDNITTKCNYCPFNSLCELTKLSCNSNGFIELVKQSLQDTVKFAGD